MKAHGMSLNRYEIIAVRYRFYYIKIDIKITLCTLFCHFLHVVNIVYYLLSIQTDRIRTYRVLFGMRCFSYMQNKHFAKSLAAILFTIQLETSSTSPNCFCNVSMPCQRVDKYTKVYVRFLKMRNE